MHLREPILQIRSNSILSYSLPVDRLYRPHQDALTQNLRQQQTYTGLFSDGAKKRLTKCIELMIDACPQRIIENPVNGLIQPFKMNFFTLTIHSTDRNVSAKECHETCLEPFLQWMRRVKGCNLYIWKAELQKRGQIHYHITTGTFVHWKEVRAKWNELARAAGYLDTYFAKYKHWNPNSIDVHSLKKIKNLSAYFLKELTKQYQNADTVNGKVWDCSKRLKEARYYTVHEDTEYNNSIHEAIKDGLIKPVYTDFCTIYKFFDGFCPQMLLRKTHALEYQQIMAAIRDKTEDVAVKKVEEIVKIPDIAPKISRIVTGFTPNPTLFSTS